MPLTDEQKAAVATLSSADAEEVAEALKNEANPVYNRVFGAGVTTGKQQVQGKLDSSTAELTTAKEEADRLRGELEELKAKTPDVATAVSQEAEKWQKRLEKDVAAVTEKLTAAEAKVARLTTDTVAEKVANALLAKQLDPEYVRDVAPARAGRIKFDENGNPVLYDSTTDTPVQIPDGKSPFEVLAEQVFEKAPAGVKLSGVDAGGGAAPGGGAGGYDPVKAGKEMAAASKASDNSLAFQ